MNQKQIGAIVIIIGLALAGYIYFAKQREDEYIRQIMKQNNGSCFIGDTCLHADRTITLYIIAGVLSVGLVVLGIYLLVFDKTQKALAENQLKLSSALEKASRNEKEKDEFHAFLSGFSQDEQKILKAIYDQDGILQSTLRYRTGMSKTTLSLMLQSLEEREIISKNPEGKTNKVFLRKKF